MINTASLPAFQTQNTGFNIGRLYYRNYSVNREDIPEKNNLLLGLSDVKYIKEPSNVNTKIPLTTIYPGILSGSGYLHEVKNDEEAFKLGFFFDHTSGMPVIPGSAVKGALRSAFPHFEQADIEADFNEDRYQNINWLSNDKKRELKEMLPLKRGKALFIHNLVFDEKRELEKDELRRIYQIEQEVFEGTNPTYITASDEDKKSGVVKEYFNIYHRDIFHDAVPLKIEPNFKGNLSRLFGSDYITPHKHRDRPELDQFTNPTPIKFLKIMPNVIFEFRFKLNSSPSQDGLDVTKKKILVCKILTILGIGAKTNVGYGQFEQPPKPREFTVGEEIEAMVANIDRTNGNRVTFQLKGHSDLIRPVSQRELDFLIIGETVKLKISELTAMKSIKKYDLMPPIPQKPRKR